eukprot:Unigene12452_Nuclearia_a/m.37837 Unigene12452_Nuclearia_a/g.37837  ORF Unigene12452_Nuclearia_a/g.37837 Unigene12452_Nuclearia_a/m.37837 type:complete len:127 (-) Unigene12452_Nuclearia_a:15-395(-)
MPLLLAMFSFGGGRWHTDFKDALAGSDGNTDIGELCRRHEAAGGKLFLANTRSTRKVDQLRYLDTTGSPDVLGVTLHKVVYLRFDGDTHGFHFSNMASAPVDAFDREQVQALFAALSKAVPATKAQ